MTRYYTCENCGYEGPCYGALTRKGPTKPFCYACEQSGCLTEMKDPGIRWKSITKEDVATYCADVPTHSRLTPEELMLIYFHEVLTGVYPLDEARNDIIEARGTV